MKARTTTVNVLWLATIAYASLLMWLAIVHVPMRMVPASQWQLDKLYHGVAYMVLGVLVARTLWLSGPSLSRRLVAACAIAVVLGYGVMTERLQAAVYWRSVEELDAAANAAGALLGVAVWSRLEPRESGEH